VAEIVLYEKVEFVSRGIDDLAGDRVAVGLFILKTKSRPGFAACTFART
jgi:hypothetical protein